MRKLIRQIRSWIKAFIYALLTMVVIKSFCWVYVIPSTSMEKTLLPGDLIFVNKMSYGLRLPITPITFPMSHQTMPFNDQKKSYWDIINLPYHRLFGSQVKRNDILVFNYPREDDKPIDHRSFYVKRVIALPSDTLRIIDNRVYVNRKLVSYPENVEFNYKVETDGTLSEGVFMSYGVSEGKRLGVQQWQLTMSNHSKDSLKQNEHVFSIDSVTYRDNELNGYIFPYHTSYKWSIDQYGPLNIPSEGNTINLDTNNIHIYKRIIEVYEENKLEFRQNEFFINGIKTSNYTFKMNYYFVLGDNRHNSSDSRFFGLVPENHVLGKAQFILLSANKSEEIKNKYRWNRFFKKID